MPQSHRRPTSGRRYAAVAFLLAVLATAGVALTLRGHSPSSDVSAGVEGQGTFGVAPTTPGASPTPTPSAQAPSPTPSPTRRPSRGTGTSTRNGIDGIENEVLRLTNAERALHGCPAVKDNPKLRNAAGLHSADQAAHNTMSHTGSDGSTPWERAERAGYDDAMSENVAYGYPTAAAVVEGWMNSPGHRANILNCAARAVGIGLAYSSGGQPYWTQLFGRT